MGEKVKKYSFVHTDKQMNYFAQMSRAKGTYVND